MSVIALSGLTGGGARIVGPLVADRLHVDYVDRLILTTAAQRIGATVEALSEREQGPLKLPARLSALMERILNRSSFTVAGTDPFFGAGAMALLTEEFENLPSQLVTRGHEIDENQYISALREVIEVLASQGNVVIVGRGSSIILANRPSVLRVGVSADMETRVRNVMKVEGITDEAAKRFIATRDQARSNYYARFLDVDNPDDPELYHLVINTSATSFTQAAELIVSASKIFVTEST